MSNSYWKQGIRCLVWLVLTMVSSACKYSDSHLVWFSAYIVCRQVGVSLTIRICCGEQYTPRISFMIHAGWILSNWKSGYAKSHEIWASGKFYQYITTSLMYGITFRDMSKVGRENLTWTEFLQTSLLHFVAILAMVVTLGRFPVNKRCRVGSWIGIMMQCGWPVSFAI